jgi:hypothetical protein
MVTDIVGEGSKIERWRDGEILLNCRIDSEEKRREDKIR